MLATLIGLVHRYEAHLPGERAVLYDLCVKTMLETWPAARQHRFREIDERQQRAYLETLAYRMQSARKPEREVTIGRDELVASLVDIVRDRQGPGHPETTQGLIERWVSFLEVGSGLLVEQRPGFFCFFHLSLMEYLAAGGMGRAGDLDAAVARHWSDSTWFEVCLLALGSRATDKRFLDRVYQLVSGQEEQPGRWSFLLHAMREEAVFDDEQRATIVRSAAQALLDKSPRAWHDDQQAFDDLAQRSLRHGEWSRRWLENELRSADNDRLQAAVALHDP